MTCCENSTPGTPKRRRSSEHCCNSPSPGDHHLNLSEEPVLIPLLEDLAIWLSGFLNQDISPENFIELFEDGVLLCKLGKILQEKALEYKELTKHSYPLPSYSIKKWYPNPKIGSFFCRDNVCKFISWCKQFGVPEICLFESNDIVEHRTVRALRNVLICLLDVGKIGVKHGIEPSELVRIDLEIDQEIQQEMLYKKSPALVITTPTRCRSGIPTPRKSRIPKKASSLASSIASSSEPASSEEEEVYSSPEPDEEELERIRLKLLSLDEQVRAIVSRCTCKTPFQLDRVGDGKYKLPNTSQIFFVRILRNHVMVRVGGGWDTLDHFIAKHDPCRMKFKQISGTPNFRGVKSKIDNTLRNTEPKPRNRSMSMISPTSSEPPQPWIQEDLAPLAKIPRQHCNFRRSKSARYVRRLSYSSESEDLNYVAPVRGGSEGSTSSIPDSEFELIEDKLISDATFSPLITFRKKGKKHVCPDSPDEDEQLTSFNQTPKKSSSLLRTKSMDRSKNNKVQNSGTPRSMIPVPVKRSKSCERNNMVSNTPNRLFLKHSKSTEHQNHMVVAPQHKVSTPITPSFLSRKDKEKELKSVFVKTPQSLLNNPTSATARKVLRSKSSENVAQHLVNLSKANNTSLPRSRTKSGDYSRNVVKTPGNMKPNVIKKSKSSDLSNKHKIVSMKPRDSEIIMKPDLSALNTPKSNNRSFRDWLKKRRNEI